MMIFEKLWLTLKRKQKIYVLVIKLLIMKKQYDWCNEPVNKEKEFILNDLHSILYKRPICFFQKS